MTVSSMPKVGSEWQRFEQLSAPALYELLRFRQQIFVVEQRSPYADLDGLDHGARHLLLRDSGGAIAGYLRLVPSPVLRIGRVAVASHLRGRGLGHTLMKQALFFCREHYPEQQVMLAAQLPLVPFYQGFGFAAISEPFNDFGIMHVEMAMRGLTALSAGPKLT
jgi:ElaA protein